MEAIVVKAVARELGQVLPARVQAVLQPSPREIVLALRGAASHELLLSTDPGAARLHLVRARPVRVPVPTAFCRLLRKHLEGKVLIAAECPGAERVVRLVFARGSGPRRELLLFVEIMGKHSNLILVEASGGIVVDSLQHVAPPMSRVRTVLPGVPYEPPPLSGRVDPAALAEDESRAIWREADGRPEALFRRVLGLGPATLALVSGEARLDPAYAVDPGGAFFRALARCRETVERGMLRPTIYPARDVLLPLPVPGWETDSQRTLPTMNEAAEVFAAERGERRELHGLRDERERRLRRDLKKVVAEERMRRDETADDRVVVLQAAGAVLLAAAGEHPRGAASLRLPDPGGGPEREIALDPALGPRQNAERLFRTARKIRRRADLALERLPGVVARRRLLEEELAALPGLPVEALREPAATGGKAAQPAPGKTAAAAPGVREYRSPEGWRILVGKSGAGNDRLTGRIAAPEDWWLHARDYPGAHVVLKVAGGDPPAEALRVAAEIAAWHSGARSEGMAEVSYTRRRHVRKVKGGPPGKVLLAQASSLRVRPRVPEGVVEVKG